jgi:hypothetical protein
MKIYKLIAICIVFILLSGVNTSASHNIKIEIKGLSNSEIFLARYYFDTQYIIDTTILDKQGYAMFAGKDNLKAGIYYLVFPNKKSIEFLVGHDQDLMLRTTLHNSLTNLSFEGADQTRDYFRFNQYLQEKNAIKRSLQMNYLPHFKNKDSIQSLRKKIKEIGWKTQNYKDSLLQKYDNHILGIILNINSFPDFDEQEAEKGSKQYEQAFYQHKLQFFDDIDFNDERILYTPGYHNRLRVFFNKKLTMNADTINAYIEYLFGNHSMADEVYKNTLGWIYETYKPKSDSYLPDVYFFVSTEYYIYKKPFWISDEDRQQLTYAIAKRFPAEINKNFPPVYGVNKNGKQIVIPDQNKKYSFIVFWRTECDYCKKELKDLRKKYLELDIDVVTIYIGKNEKEWLQKINSFPPEWTNIYDPYQKTNFKNAYNVKYLPFINILSPENILLGTSFQTGEAVEVLEAWRINQ